MSLPVLIRKYPMHPRLGRHQVLDPRSLAFVEGGAGVHLREVDHEPPCPVLDQEDLHAQGISVRGMFPDAPGLDDADALGSCVGNATVAHLSQVIGMDRLELPADQLTKAAEVLAIRRYHRATQLDSDLTDTYPVVDCGSSGLGSARACKADGLISGYRHATSAMGLLALLQSGTVLMGMPWYNAMFNTDPDGFVDTHGWQDTGVAGGHEVCVTAIERLVLDRAGHPAGSTVLRVRNSWSQGWGWHGSFRLRLATYQALRSQVDLIQFVA